MGGQMSNIVTMIESGSIMLLSVLAVSLIYIRFARQFWTVSILLGVLFTIVGVVVMENSVEIVPGIRTDPRGAVVVLSAAFGGPVSVAITAPCLALLRFVYGGGGAIPGAAYILGVGVAAALAWFWWFRTAHARPSIPYVLVQAVIAGTVPTIVLLFVSSAPWEVFLTSNVLTAPTNFVATLLMGTMLVRDLDRARAIRSGEDKQAQIDAISEHAPVALFQIVREEDGVPRFTYVSRAATRIVSIRPEDLLRDFRTLDQISKAAGADFIKDKLDASEEEFAPWSAEVELRTRAGNQKWVQFDSGIRMGRDGECIWDGSIIDITEQKVSAKLKDEFISTVSHELRTPLTSIRGSLGLVIGSASAHLPTKVLSMLDIASRNAERLVLLINDILDMQKIRSGQMEFSLTEQEVRPHLEQALASSENYAPEKGICFALEDRAPHAVANIDPVRFNQILGNLLSNAIKFSPKGSTVTLSVHHVKGMLRISVKDEGPGIPAEFRDKIFQPFSQSEKSTTRSVGGTGLGLNISTALVEAMNGTLTFDSIEGHGATFHIDLPAVETAADEARPVMASGIRSQRLLVCSDDKDFTWKVTEVAHQLQLSADVAGNEDAAFSLARQDRYAALILDDDTVAPISLVARIRQVSEAWDIPVIVASEGDEEALEAMMVKVAKPVEISDLHHVLSATLSPGRTQSHVLYVEDDEYLHQIFQQNFGEKVRMTGAKTLAEARASIAAHQFDLVLLDLELPDGSGAHFLRELPVSTPVIVFSAHEMDPDIVPRVKSIMTKSRVRETDVVEAVLATLDGAGERELSVPDVA